MIDAGPESMQLVAAAWQSTSQVHVVFQPISGVTRYRVLASSSHGDWSFFKEVMHYPATVYGLYVCGECVWCVWCVFMVSMCGWYVCVCVTVNVYIRWGITMCVCVFVCVCVCVNKDGMDFRCELFVHDQFHINLLCIATVQIVWGERTDGA